MRLFRNLIMLTFVTLALSTGILAQVSGYVFAESAGTYTALVGTNSTATGDDGTQNGIPIGFNFNLGGTVYTHFCIDANGWIKLGNAATTIGGSNWVNSLGNAATHRPLIAALWDDNNRNTGAITYSTTGAAGSQVLTVDWNAVSIGGGGSTGGNASFQIKIYETTNVVEIIYGGTLAIDPGGLSASVGLNDSTSFISVTPGSPGTASGVTANNGIAATTLMVSKMYTFTPPPPSVFFSTTSYSVAENGVNAVVTVNRAGSTAAIASVDVVTSDGSATTPGDYTGGTYSASFGIGISSTTVNIPITDDAVFEFGESFNVTLMNPIGVPLGTPVAAVVGISDNEQIPAGSYTVGSGGNYASLTNGGGVFEAINAAGVAGAVTVNIVSNLTGETGVVTLNPIAGNPAVLIKPSGAPRTISGIAPIAVIRINGADNIRIDGSTAAAIVGGNPALRELTVNNLSTSTSSGVIAIGSATESSTGNTIQNVNVSGNDPVQTLLGISIGGATPGTAGLFTNNNSRVENCSVRRAVFGIFSSGVAATPNTGTVITQNDLTGTTTERIRRAGIIVFNDNGVQITENSVGGIDNTGESADAIGIGVGTQGVLSTGTTSGGVSNAIVNRNKVNGVSQDATFSAAGIAVAGGTLGANIISNNMISGVIADANAGDIVAGIWVAGVAGSVTRLFYNSVSMTGNRSALLTPGTAQFPSYGVAITGTDPTVELKNNIFYTTQTVDLVANPAAFSYAIGMQSTTFANLDSNYNDFFSTGANDMGFRTTSLSNTGGVNIATVALWGAAVADDANSVILGEVDPAFTSPLNDLHLTGATLNPLYDKGIAVSVLDDHDGSIRSVVGFAGGVPDIGADEFVAPVAANASISGRVAASDGRGIRNVVVTLAGGNLSQPRVIRSSTFGYYTFEDLEVGETYVLTVNSKRFTFSVPSRVITLNENVEDADFTADAP